VGYWEEDLSWHPGKINPFGWMVDDMIEKYEARKKLRNNLPGITFP
jgi:hypothetical protein